MFSFYVVFLCFWRLTLLSNANKARKKDKSFVYESKKKPSRRNESNGREDSPTFKVSACLTLAKYLIMINGFLFLRAAYNENISKYKEETLRCFNKSEIYLRITIQN